MYFLVMPPLRWDRPFEGKSEWQIIQWCVFPICSMFIVAVWRRMIPAWPDYNVLGSASVFLEGCLSVHGQQHLCWGWPCGDDLWKHYTDVVTMQENVTRKHAGMKACKHKSSIHNRQALYKDFAEEMCVLLATQNFELLTGSSSVH